MKRLQCEICGSEKIVKSGNLFVCKSCGCRFLPDSYYEDRYLERDEVPSIEEVLSHEGPNPVRVKKDYNGIRIVDEYTGTVYTVEEYKTFLDNLKHKPSIFKRIRKWLGNKFGSVPLDKVFTVLSAVLSLLFIVLGILSIRNGDLLWHIVFRFYIAVCCGMASAFCAESGHWYAFLIGLIVQIVIGAFLFFGLFFNLEWLWRILLSIVLTFGNYLLLIALTGS